MNWAPQRQKIGIFGGSFNPPHIGHTAICRFILDQKMVDEVWVIPCFEHPLEKELLSYTHRRHMCELALEHKNLPIHILDIEKELGGISYTARTLKELHQRYPEKEFFLCVGEDIPTETSQWKNLDEIKKLAQFLILPRGDHSPIPAVSSSQIREFILKREDISSLVEPPVAKYIQEQGVYKVK